MAAALPPIGEVGTGLAEAEPLLKEGVGQYLLSDSPKQLDAVKSARCALLCDWVDNQGGVWELSWGGGGGGGERRLMFTIEPAPFCKFLDVGDARCHLIKSIK